MRVVAAAAVLVLVSRMDPASAQTKAASPFLFASLAPAPGLRPISPFSAVSLDGRSSLI
jgi:hypothetical protein